MSELIWQGLQVSALGMGLTFAALGLLILTMKALERFFRVPIVEEEGAAIETTAVPSNEEDEIAVAIAVALNHLQASKSGPSDLGTNLEAGRGAWWQINRARQHNRLLARQTSWRNHQ